MQSKHYRNGVSAIVPAYNEETTILKVITLLQFHPLVSEVIVVSDGSTDTTAQKARDSGVIVIELEENCGKGIAMNIGVQRAQYDILLFMDADIKGLTNLMVTDLVKSVQSGGYVMRTLARDRIVESYQFYVSSLVLGGERALRRELWDLVPDGEKKGFGIELALNYYARRHGHKADYLFAPGLGQTPKEMKYGIVKGFFGRVSMIMQCTNTYCRLFLLQKENVSAYNTLPAPAHK